MNGDPMANALEREDPVSRFVHRVRLRHVLIALGCHGDDGAWSLFDGSVESGFSLSFDLVGSCLALAWSVSGVVALLDVTEDHKNDPQGPLSLEGAIGRYLGDLPTEMQGLLTRLNAHPHRSRAETASAAFWLSRDQPNLERLQDDRLQLLRGFVCAPDVAIHGDGARWKGWAETVDLNEVSMTRAIPLEQASRHATVDLSREEAEALISGDIFVEVPEPSGLTLAVRPPIEAPSGNVAVMAEMLAQVGIRWPSLPDGAGEFEGSGGEG